MASRDSKMARKMSTSVYLQATGESSLHLGTTVGRVQHTENCSENTHETLRGGFCSKVLL